MKELLQTYYQAFSKCDYATMADCYHPEARFSDPVFPNLLGKEIGAMWKMLLSGAKDFVVTCSEIQVDGDKGRAAWKANYRFSKTGRPVVNVVTSAFEFKDGKIFRQKDSFDFWKWQGMAFGLAGKFLGWTPLMKNALRNKTAKALRKFMDRED